MRTFYFTSLNEAIARCEEDGLPLGAIRVIKRNQNGRPIEVEVSVPAELYAA